GAVTWCNGTTSTTGVVSESNSLVGTQTIDQVGSRIVPLINGNYVVQSPGWANGSARFAGAVTLCDGTTGMSGVVNAANSLVGVRPNDHVGGGGVIQLSNGACVVASPRW